MPRRPRKIDPPHVILKRLKFARRIRSILYGTAEDATPNWGDKHRSRRGFYCREMSWAFGVAEFVSDRSFHYFEILNETDAMVTEHGGPWPAVGLPEDLELLKAWRFRLAAKRKAEGRRVRGLAEIRDASRAGPSMAAQRAKDAMLQGLCPACGGELPCAECDVPEVEFDGRGGLRAKRVV